MAPKLVKKKRTAGDIGLDHEPEIDLVQAFPSRKKKARFQRPDDDFSDFPASSANSVADTNVATGTIACASTPPTVATSSRSNGNQRPKIYFCTFEGCDKAFDRPVRLQTHINTHTGERPHTCPMEDCDKSFYKPEHLNRHMKEKHGNQRFICTFEVRKEEIGIIEPCQRVFESAEKLRRHVAMHEDKEETTCSWEGCGKVFRKQKTLQRHIKKDHLNEDAYLCTHDMGDGGQCGRTFPTIGQLKGHEAKDHQAPKYVCEICTSAMVDTVEDDMPMPNDLDPAFLPTAEDMGHIRDEFDSKILDSLTLDDKTISSSQHPSGLVCFPTYHDLQRHNKLAHPPICPECDKKCKSNKDLAAHMDIEHPSSDGPISSSSLPSKPQKKFLCPFEGCSRSLPGNGFTRRGNMDVHYKSAHGKQKDFVCGQHDLNGIEKVQGWSGEGCGKALVTKAALIGHVRTQHLGLPPTCGVSISLQGKERKSGKPRVKQGARKVDDIMDMNAVPEHPAPSAALSLLTGAGYEELRPYGCLSEGGGRGCQVRFTKQYDLCTHMELTHGWNVDDINDAIEADGLLETVAEHGMVDTVGGNASYIDPQLCTISA